MAASAWNPLNPRIISKTGIPRILYGCLEANSQTFKAGTPVYLNSGAVTVAADTFFTGIAMKDATNVTSGNIEIPIQIAGPEDEIIARVTSGSGTLALASTMTPGTVYDWYVDSDVVFYVDSSDTTGATLIFMEEIEDVNGDSTYWGKFRVAFTTGTDDLNRSAT